MYFLSVAWEALQRLVPGSPNPWEVVAASGVSRQAPATLQSDTILAIVLLNSSLPPNTEVFELPESLRTFALTTDNKYLGGGIKVGRMSAVRYIVNNPPS